MPVPPVVVVAHEAPAPPPPAAPSLPLQLLAPPPPPPVQPPPPPPPPVPYVLLVCCCPPAPPVPVGGRHRSHRSLQRSCCFRAYRRRHLSRHHRYLHRCRWSRIHSPRLHPTGPCSRCRSGFRNCRRCHRRQRCRRGYRSSRHRHHHHPQSKARCPHRHSSMNRQTWAAGRQRLTLRPHHRRRRRTTIHWCTNLRLSRRQRNPCPQSHLRWGWCDQRRCRPHHPRRRSRCQPTASGH